jgi:MFS superfamily sulfate permease-like transporter
MRGPDERAGRDGVRALVGAPAPEGKGGIRLFRGIRPITARRAARDALAGVNLAAMNVPQALGYTTIAGMPVVTGLYTLLLPVLAFAALGSSRFLVVAADSATAAILASGLAPMAEPASERYVALAGLVAALTAAFLLAARAFRLGFLSDFLSQTVLIGFLTGVGFQVGIAVLGEMLGIAVTAHGAPGQLLAVAHGLSAVDLRAVALSAAVVAVILACRRLAPRLPGTLVAVAGAIGVSIAYDFAGRGLRMIGPVAGGLPDLTLPALAWRDIRELIPVAASCFMVIVAQSAATARIYADRHRQELDENDDLVGLAAANVAAAATGTFVVNGSPTQTAMVEAAGGRSQLAHVTVAAVVAVVLVFISDILQYLPRCVLGAIVFTIAVGLVNLASLAAIRRESRGEFRLAVATAVVVVAAGVELGILMAMALSLMRHVRHSYLPHISVLVCDDGHAWHPVPARPGTVSQPGVVVLRFGADLFYANAARFAASVRSLVIGRPEPVRWLVVDAAAITAVDYSAARVIAALLADLQQAGVSVILIHAMPSLLHDLERHRLLEGISEEHIIEKLHDALAFIERATRAS